MPAIYSFWRSIIAPRARAGDKQLWEEKNMGATQLSWTLFFSSTFIHINNITWFKSTTLFFNHTYLFIYQSTIEELEGQSLLYVWCKCIYIFKCPCSCLCAGACNICAPCTYVCEVQRSKLAVFLNHTAPYFLTESLSLNFELRNCWDNLTSRLLVSSCVSFAQCWDYRPAAAMPSFSIWVLVIRT